MKNMYMGIDVGSSGCKVSVVNEEGIVTAFAERRYAFQYEGGYSELDPEVVLKNVKDAMKEITFRFDMSALLTLSVTSFGEMFVLLDENRKVLCPSISYNDHRGMAEAQMLHEHFGNDEIYEITGATINAMYSLPKLLWIKHNQPEVYRKAKKLCLFADFILMKLGAEDHIDYSLASRTLMFDVRNRCWSEEILEFAGINQEILSNPVPTGTIVGKISVSLANELGLPASVLLLAGGHDQSCAALGAGIVNEGMALDGMGSNECIVPTFSRSLIHSGMKKANLVCVPYILPDMYVTYAFNRSAGTVLDWYVRLLGNVSYEELLGEMSVKPSKTLFLPHFAGAATPYMDDEAKGAVMGLDLSTTKGELTRSIIEGLQFEVMINLQCLKDAGFSVRELFASGGMSQSDHVLQMKADILGLPVHRLENPQTGTLAMAILGSVSKGIYPDISSAVAALVRRGRAFYPDARLHEEYGEMFEQYKNMYHAVKMVQRR